MELTKQECLLVRNGLLLGLSRQIKKAAESNYMPTVNMHLSTAQQYRELLDKITIDAVVKRVNEDARICSACSKEMTVGYCVGDGANYYCSDECLHTEMTQEEYNALYDDGQAYWTEWEVL